MTTETIFIRRNVICWFCGRENSPPACMANHTLPRGSLEHTLNMAVLTPQSNMPPGQWKSSFRVVELRRIFRICCLSIIRQRQRNEQETEDSEHGARNIHGAPTAAPCTIPDIIT